MEIASALLAVILLAILTEFLVGIIKGLLPWEKIGRVKLPLIYAAVVGIVLCVLTRTDIFAALGFQLQYALAGLIITGLAISGGSTGIHELFAKMRAARLSTEVNTVNEQLYTEKMLAERSVTQGGDVPYTKPDFIPEVKNK